MCVKPQLRVIGNYATVLEGGNGCFSLLAFLFLHLLFPFRFSSLYFRGMGDGVLSGLDSEGLSEIIFSNLICVFREWFFLSAGLPLNMLLRHPGMAFKDAAKSKMRVTKPLQFFGDISLPFQLQTCADCETSHDRIGAEIFAQFC